MDPPVIGPFPSTHSSPNGLLSFAAEEGKAKVGTVPCLGDARSLFLAACREKLCHRPIGVCQ